MVVVVDDDDDELMMTMTMMILMMVLAFARYFLLVSLSKWCVVDEVSSGVCSTPSHVCCSCSCMGSIFRLTFSMLFLLNGWHSVTLTLYIIRI